MKQKQDLILIGGGGHCRSRIDVIEMEGRFSIRGIVDEKEALDPTLTAYPWLGREEDIFDLAKSCRNFLITIGQSKSPEPRIRLFKYLKRLGVTIQGVVIAGSNGASYVIAKIYQDALLFRAGMNGSPQ